MLRINPIIDTLKSDCFSLEVFEHPGSERYLLAVDADSYNEAVLIAKRAGWVVAIENDSVKITKLLNEGERELVKWQTGQAFGFTKLLWELICKADSYNLYCIERGYPREVEAYRRYSSEDGYWDDVKKRAGLIE